jgi:hypothetical protein
MGSPELGGARRDMPGRLVRDLRGGNPDPPDAHFAARFATAAMALWSDPSPRKHG